MDVRHEKKRKSKRVEAKIRSAGTPSKRPPPTDCPTAFISVDEDPTVPTTGTDIRVLSQESSSTSTSTSYSTDDIDELITTQILFQSKTIIYLVSLAFIILSFA